MAWADKLANGFYRAGYRDSAGDQRYVKDSNGDTVKYNRKSDAKLAGGEVEARARRQAAIDPTRIPGSTKFHEWYELVEGSRTFNSDRQRTIDSITAHHLIPRWGTTSLNQIALGTDLQEWVNGLTSKYSANYVRTIVSVFKADLKGAIDKGIIDNPLAGIKLPPARLRKRKTYATYSDLRLDLYQSDYRLWVEFLYETGLRPGEACGAHLTSLFEPGWITVAETMFDKGKQHYIRPYPKDGDVRRVPLTDRAHEILSSVVATRETTGGCGLLHASPKPMDEWTTCNSNLIFRRNNGKPFFSHDVSSYLYKVHRRHGLPTLSPYAYRRGFVTWAIEGGMDPLTVQKITGHAGLDELQGYFQLSPAARDRLRLARGDRPPITMIKGSGAEPGAQPSEPTQDEAGTGSD